MAAPRAACETVPVTEPAVAARRPRGRLRRALGWPPVAGAAVGLALFVIELAAVRQLGRMGATDEDLLRGIRAGGFTGRVVVGHDLGRY